MSYQSIEAARKPSTSLTMLIESHPDISAPASAKTVPSNMGVREIALEPRKRLPPLATCASRDLERGTSDDLEIQPCPTFTRFDTQHIIAAPQKARTTGLLIPTESNQASRVSSTSTLRTHEEHKGLQEKRWSDSTDSTPDTPQPKYPYQWMNVLRWEWLSVYRRLNLIVILTNIILIIVFAAQGKLIHLDPGAMSTALAANITTAVLFRQEYVVNALFLLFGCCPPTWPLWIRRLAAKIYHFGGVHSGAGLASVIWLAFLDMSLGLQYRRTGLRDRDIVIISISSLLNLLLCCVVVSSYPTLRAKYHNVWELIHRFGGWISVALFWVAFGILTDDDRQRNRPDETILEMLVTSATFWMLFTITVCLIMPWLRLRKVPVMAEYQSKYAVRLHFTYTNLPLCAAPRLSTSPLIEWHAFAGIPEESGEGFSVLISGVGDWTKKMCDDPPKKIWTRGIPVRGVLHIAPIFKKMVLVATGSGIGPVLSLLYARAVECRILWCTRDPTMSYQPDVLEHVYKADPQAQIFARTKGQKDPDLGRLAYDLYRESGAEAVFIISNKEGCFKARIWLESRGVCVFTPIFDS